MIEDLLKKFEEDQELNKLINKRVHWLHAPDNIYPSVIIKEMTCVGIAYADDEMYEEESEIKISIQSKDSTIPITNEIKRILRNLGYAYALLEDKYEKETEVYKKEIRCLISKEVD